MTEIFLADSLKLTVARAGPSEGEPVLLLHSTGSSWNGWALNMNHLPPDRPVIVPDLPGFGDSEAPDRFFSIGDYAQALAPLAERPPVLVGNSLGGLVALEMAAQRPAAGLVLVAAPANPPEDPDANLARLIGWFDERGVPSIPSVEELRRVTVQADERILALANANMARARSFLASLPAVFNYPWRARAREVKCPVALFWGEQDGLVSRAHLERWQEAFPQATTVVFPGAAHGPQFDAPEAFNRALSEFLANI